jgi:probable HAF family extracellular repeat protein
MRRHREHTTISTTNPAGNPARVPRTGGALRRGFHALLAVGAIGGALPTAHAAPTVPVHFTVMRLDTPPGLQAIPDSISPAGFIGGYYLRASGYSAGFVAAPGQSAIVRVCDDQPFTCYVSGVNDAGVAMGAYGRFDFGVYATFRVRADGSGFETIHPGPDVESITSRGVDAQGRYWGQVTIFSVAAHAYVAHPNGRRIDLGSLVGPTGTSVANAANATGTVVGSSTAPGGSQHAFVLRAHGAMRDLGTLGGSWSSALAVSDSGWVVGTSEVLTGANPPTTLHAFAWRNGGPMQDLGALPGDQDSSLASSVNRAGHAVGESGNSWTPRAFIADLAHGGHLVDLNTLVDMPAGVTLLQGMVINDSDVIAARGSDGGVWVLTPVAVH